MELILFCFDLLVGHGSVEVGIGVIHRTILLNRLLARKCSIGAKTQFVTLYRPLPMTCSQRLCLDDRGDHLCRNGGVKGRYFERADRGAGLTHAPIFGVQLGSACSLAIRVRAHHLMTRCASQVWRGSAYTYTVAVAALSLYKQDVAQGLLRTKMSCRAPQSSFPIAYSVYTTLRQCTTT